jgi:hypothetical protein
VVPMAIRTATARSFPTVLRGDPPGMPRIGAEPDNSVIGRSRSPAYRAYPQAVLPAIRPAECMNCVDSMLNQVI